MSPESIITNPTVPRFREAFERQLPKIRAVPEQEFLSINLDIPGVVATILGTWFEIRGLRDEIAKQLPSFDMEQFDELETSALALGHAQTQYQTATEPPASLIALGDKAIRLRELLLSEVNVQILRGNLEPGSIKDLRGAHGYKNVSFDLFALANLLKINWAKFSERTSLAMAELDEAENTADKLVTAVGVREQAPTVATQAVKDRQGAFTLLVNDYDEVRAAIGFVRRKQGDAETLAPSLYAGRSAAKKKATEDTTTATPAPTNPVTSAPTATSTTATSTNPSAGGSGPFMQ